MHLGLCSQRTLVPRTISTCAGVNFISSTLTRVKEAILEKNDDFQIEVAPAPDALDARARYPAAEPRAGCRKRSSEPRGARVRVTGLGDRVDRSNRPRSPGLRLAVRRTNFGIGEKSTSATFVPSPRLG
jgi:hypothetical protein